MKVLFTYGNETREGFTSKSPSIIEHIESDSVEEAFGGAVLEKIPDLISFVDQLYRVMRPGAKATFTSMYFASAMAWMSPLTKRGISEFSLSFASKAWRDSSGWSEGTCLADFDISTGVQMTDELQARSDEHRAFAVKHWNNTMSAIHFYLVKK